MATNNRDTSAEYLKLLSHGNDIVSPTGKPVAASDKEPKTLRIVDSDFLFVTNDPIIVENAKRCYREYPTIVNNLQESGITYHNTPEDYSLMDCKLSKSRRGIGESSNLAQLAMTYYWTEVQSDKPDEKKIAELYDNFVILSVLAQLIIDSSKKTYEVDALAEIERIKHMSCMNPTDADGHKKDFPLFMKYTREVPVTKNGKDLPYDVISSSRDKIKKRINPELICPMNYLQSHLDKIQGASTKQTIPTEDFFIHMRGGANSRQVSKIVQIAQEYDTYIKSNIDKLFEDETRFEFMERTQEFYEEVAKVKISNPVTINRLIEIALNLNFKMKRNFRHLEAHKYGRLILKALYKMNPEKFLQNFAKG